jgi:hypothetical protein
MPDEIQAVDYAAVLADLEARRAQIDAAIAVIRPLAGQLSMAMPPIAVTPAGTGIQTAGAAVEIREDSFFSLSIPEAVKKYLAMRKRPASTSEIIDALKRGGQINSSSDSFKASVPSVLDRANSTGKGIVRVSRGTWGLAEWYPNRPKKSTNDDD